MAKNNRFNEKEKEYSAKQKTDVPVWQSPKYLESRDKAIEMIDSKKYGLKDGDFWILMNETKSGKMAYTGLIISHNGCLKINDSLSIDLKFEPSCVFVTENGYKNSLVFTYNCPEQGIYEVGEVNAENCKMAYPYAMALKRCFDRVVLKNSKLAYAGVYSEAEADEFKHDDEPPKNEPKKTEEPPKGEPNNTPSKSEAPDLTPFDDDDFHYCTKEQIDKMRELKVNELNVCRRMKVDSIEELSVEQAEYVISAKLKALGGNK